MSDAGERLSVVFLLDHLVPFGGAEILVAEIAKRIDQRRFAPIVCATRTIDPAVRSDLEESGVEVIHLARTHRGRVDQWRPFVRLLRERKVAILHAHKFGSNLWAAVLRGFVPVPVVIAHEHVWSFEGGLSRRLLDRFVVSPSVDLTLTVSEHTRQQMIDVEHLPPEGVRAFTHGVPRLRAQNELTRAELDLAASDLVVATVCVLRPQKAVEQLFYAAAQLTALIPHLRILVVGDGAERSKLKKTAAEVGLEDVVRFLGHRSDAREIVALADICVNSSRFEGSPLAVMEYMAAARPIVATAVGGVPEIIDHGVNGLLVPPDNPDALAAAIARLATDKRLRARLGARASRDQRERFDLDQNLRRLEDLYEELVARRSGAGHHGATGH